MSDIQTPSGGNDKIATDRQRTEAGDFDLKEVPLAREGGEVGTVNLDDRPVPGTDVASGVERDLTPTITKEILEEKLKAIAALDDPVKQMRAARQLSEELFGSKDKAIRFVTDLSEQIVQGNWDTSTNFNPNGFFKMSVGKVDGIALRLHFNSRTVDIPEGGRIEENVHDHRWSFVSTLLTGQFQHTMFKQVDKDEPGAIALHQYSYAPRGGKEVFEMQHIGTDYLKEVNTVTPAPFKPFQLPATRIHRAAYPLQDTEMTVTAVITLENAGRDSNFVWANDEIHSQIEESKGTTPTPKCDEGTQIMLLRELSTALGAH